jgi:hypothetical protein
MQARCQLLQSIGAARPVKPKDPRPGIPIALDACPSPEESATPDPATKPGEEVQMLAGPDVSLWTMRRAIAYTIAALAAAGEIDVDRADDDREFFASEKEKLAAFPAVLQSAETALEAFDLGTGMQCQVRVELGDAVLDRGVRSGNARTKLELQGKSGLGADHVFGSNVSELTNARLKLEPGLVLAAIGRMKDLPAFGAREAIEKDLAARANKQESLLGDRDGAALERNALESAAVKLVADASIALTRTKSALDNRFPRQRDYVASFFLDVSRRRRKDASAPPAAPPAPA